MYWAFKGLSAALQPGAELSSLSANWLMSLGVAGLYLSLTLYMSLKVQDMIRVTGELSSI
jgi:hypothetical protein